MLCCVMYPRFSLTTVNLGTRLPVIFADMIVLAVTWIKALGTVRDARRLNIRVPLSEVLVRDGE